MAGTPALGPATLALVRHVLPDLVFVGGRGDGI